MGSVPLFLLYSSIPSIPPLFPPKSYRIIELVHPAVSLDLLVRSLLTLGASEKDLAKVIAAAN